MFRRQKRATKQSPVEPLGPMELRLPFPPNPEHMADHAANLVGIVQRIDSLDLDYEVDSLAVIDSLLERFHDERVDPTRIAETLFAFGSYIGEVIVRARAAEWTLVPNDHAIGVSDGWPLVRLQNGNLLNPIGKAFK